MSPDSPLNPWHEALLRAAQKGRPVKTAEAAVAYAELEQGGYCRRRDGRIELTAKGASTIKPVPVPVRPSLWTPNTTGGWLVFIATIIPLEAAWGWLEASVHQHDPWWHSGMLALLSWRFLVGPVYRWAGRHFGRNAVPLAAAPRPHERGRNMKKKDWIILVLAVLLVISLAAPWRTEPRPRYVSAARGVVLDTVTGCAYAWNGTRLGCPPSQ